jgi:glutathione S-transferase
MLKIWGFAGSSNVQKVMWAADEIGLPWEHIDINGPKLKEPAYLALNPNGLVPTIEDDGFVLWESNTILRYLASKHKKLAPADPAARAAIECWMDWQLASLVTCMAPLFRGWARTPPEQRDLAALARHRESAVPLWTLLDRHLDGRAYVGGADFTIGDMPPAVWIHRWYVMPIERPELPNLRAWYEKLLTRPPYKKYVAVPIG